MSGGPRDEYRRTTTAVPAPGRVRRRFDELEDRPRVVTIGTFDGVHVGHRSLLGRTRARAGELGLPVLAVTFEPLPAMVLRPERFSGRLCTAADKLRRLAEGGADEIVVLAFNRDFSEQSPEAFMAALAAGARPVEVLVGEEFALGRHRAGDVPRLTAIGRDLGFAVRAVPRLTDGETVISSSAIRAAIERGDVTLAMRYLGRPFSVTGPVVHGAHFGRTIGYPTANVEPPHELVGLADGIYATLATLPDGYGPRPAMTYVGTRPTVNTGDRLVETHLLDFDGDLYGWDVRVDVLERLRPDETYPTIDAMVAQLRRDEAATRSALRRLAPDVTSPSAAGVRLA